MPQWYDITRKPEYQALPPEDRATAKQEYFERFILPKINEDPDLKGDEDVRKAAFYKFMQSPDDSGQGIITSAIGGAARGFGEIVPGAIQGAGALTGIDALESAGKSIREGLEYVAPVNPLYQESIPVKGAGVAGQIGSVLATAGVGGAIGKGLAAERIAAGATAAEQALAASQAVGRGANTALYGSAGLQGAASGAQSADQYGLTGANRYGNVIAGALGEIGSELLPFGLAAETAAAKRLLTGAPQTGRALGAIGSEGLEEASNQVFQNAALKALAPTGTETPGLTEGALEAGAYGALGGGLLAGVNIATGAYKSPATIAAVDLNEAAKATAPIDTAQTTAAVDATIEASEKSNAAADFAENLRRTQEEGDAANIQAAQMRAQEEYAAAQAAAERQAQFDNLTPNEPLVETPAGSPVLPTGGAEVANLEAANGANEGLGNLGGGILPEESDQALGSPSPENLVSDAEVISPTIQPGQAEQQTPQEDATNQGNQQNLAQEEYQNGNQSREETSASGGNRVFSPATGQEEVITPATETPTSIATEGQPMSGDSGSVVRDKTKPEQMTPEEFDESVKQSGREYYLKYGKNAPMRVGQLNVLQDALEKKLPVSVAAFDAQVEKGRPIKLPEGYVRQGDLYIYRPSGTVEAKPAPPAKPGQRDVTKPEQMTPEEYSSSERDTELPKNYVLSDGNGNFVTEEKNGWFKVWRLTGTHATLAGTVGFKGVEGLTKAKTRLKEVSAEMHEEKLKDGLRTRKPVSAEAVDTYGITLPEGYVRQGDLYIYRPSGTVEAKPAPPAKPAAEVETPVAGVPAEGMQRRQQALDAGLDRRTADAVGAFTDIASIMREVRNRTPEQIKKDWMGYLEADLEKFKGSAPRTAPESSLFADGQYVRYERQKDGGFKVVADEATWSPPGEKANPQFKKGKVIREFPNVEALFDYVRGESAQTPATKALTPEPTPPVQRDVTKPEQMTPEEYLTPRIANLEKEIAELEANEPKVGSSAYLYWQPKLMEAKRNLKALKEDRDEPGTDKPWAPGLQQRSIFEALEVGEPVSKAAVDAYGITLPEGYVQDGELYVYRPSGTVEAKPAPPAKPGQRDVTKPEFKPKEQQNPDEYLADFSYDIALARAERDNTGKSLKALKKEGREAYEKRIREQLRQSHVDAIKIASGLDGDSNKDFAKYGMSAPHNPVSKAAVDAYGIAIPEGYVQDGELYVYHPRLAYLKSREVDAYGGTALSDAEDAELAELQGQIAPEPAPPVQRDVTKPEQMTPEEYSASERDTELPKNYVLSDGNGNFVTEEKNGWFRVWRLTGTHVTLAGTVGFKGVEGLTKAKARLKEVSAEMHEEKLKDGLRTKRPVSAAAVDTYQITLPEGYVQDGELYVYAPLSPAPTQETPSSPAAKLEKEGVVPGTSAETEDGGRSIPPVTTKETSQAETSSGKVEAGNAALDSIIADLPSVAQAKYTPEVRAKAAKFFETRNEADLNGLTQIQKTKVHEALYRSDKEAEAAQKAADKLYEKKLREEEKENARLEKERAEQEKLTESRISAIQQTVESIVGKGQKPIMGAVSFNDGLEAQQYLNNEGNIPGILNAFVGTSKQFLANPENEKIYPKIYAFVKAGGNIAEGYFDDDSARSIVFTDGVGIHALDNRIAEQLGISPAVAAVRRVLTHEGLGHRGWLGLSEQDRAKLTSIVKSIKGPEAFDNLAKDYPQFEDWRTNPKSETLLVQEFVSKIVDGLTEIPKSGPIRRLIEMLQEIWQKFFGKKDGTLTMKELRLFVQMLQAGAEAPPNRLVNGGGIKMSQLRAQGLNAEIESIKKDFAEAKQEAEEDGSSFDEDRFIYNLSDGELELAVPQIYSDYFGNPETTSQTVFHHTPSENAEAIIKDGLTAQNKTRGIGNRGVGAAIFASAEEDPMQSYGDTVVAINLGAARKLASIGTSLEPAVEEAMRRAAVANALGVEDIGQFDVSDSDGETADTLVIRGNIPAEAIQVTDKDGNIIHTGSSFGIKASRISYASPLESQLAQAAERMRAMREKQVPQEVDAQTIRSEIRKAYDRAIIGDGSIQASLQKVFDEAKTQIPTLTERQFGEQVQALYEDGSAFLVPTDRSADMLVAGEKWGVYDVAGLPASYVGVMPVEIKASRVSSDVTNKQRTEFQKNKVTGKSVEYQGYPLIDSQGDVIEHWRTEQQYKPKERLADEFVQQIADGLDDITQLPDEVLNDDYLRSIGAEYDGDFQTLLTAQSVVLLRKKAKQATDPEERQKLEEAADKGTAFLRQGASQAGSDLKMIQQIQKDPRFAGMFAVDSIKTMKKEDQAAVVDPNFNNGAAGVEGLNNQANAEADSAMENDVDGIWLEKAESSLPEKARILLQKVKGWLAEKAADLKEMALIRAAIALKGGRVKQSVAGNKATSDRYASMTVAQLEAEFASREKRVAETDKKIEDALEKIGGALFATGNAPSEEDGKKIAKKLSKATRKEQLLKPGKMTQLQRLLDKTREGWSWKQIFTMPQAGQIRRRADMLAKVKENDAFKALNDEEKQQLVDLLDQAWYDRKAEYLGRKLKASPIIKLPFVSNKNAAKKLEEATPELLKAFNDGTFNQGVFNTILAQKYGVKPIDQAAMARAEKLAEELQDPELPDPVYAKKADELLKLIADTQDLNKAKILNDFWVTSVLAGPRTWFDIGLAALNGLQRILVDSTALALKGDVKTAGTALSRFVGIMPQAFKEAAHFIKNGDVSILVNSKDQFARFLGKGLKGGQHTATSWQLAHWNQDKEPGSPAWKKAQGNILRTIGRFMQIVERLLTALDHINATATKYGYLPIAIAQNRQKYTQARLPNEAEMNQFRTQAKSYLLGGKEPTTADEKILLDAWTRHFSDKFYSEWQDVVDGASYAGAVASGVLDPEGIVGSIYNTILGAASRATTAADALKVKADAMLQNPDINKLDAYTQHGLATLGQLAAYSARNLLGFRFIRFGATKFNDSLTYIPAIGLLRLNESENNNATKQQMIWNNQAFGVALTIIGTLAIQLIAEDDDPEKRGFDITGSLDGLTAAEKKQISDSGQKEYTLTIYRNGKPIRLVYKTWPISAALSAIGTLADMVKYKRDKWDEKQFADRLVAAVVVATTSTLDSASMSQFAELIGKGQYADDPDEAFAKKITRVGTNFAGGFVPRVFKDLDYWLLDPNARKYDTVWQNLGKEVPIARSYIGAPKLDIFANPIQTSRTPWSRAIVKQPDDEAYNTLGLLNSRDLWITPSNPELRTVGTKNRRRGLTPEEQTRYIKLVGAGYKEIVEQYGQRLLQMPKERAKAFLADKSKDVRDIAEKKAVRNRS